MPFKLLSPAFWLFAFTAAIASGSGMRSVNNSMDTVTLGNLTISQGSRIEGWVSQPDFRGTMDILWICLVTIFTCTYTILCLNVPSRNDTRLALVGRRILWMGLAIIGPEFVLTYAAGQWSRACHSVEAFHAAGYARWTMRKAFFADMGGFVLQAEDSEPFPLNVKHLHWLVINKYVDYPDVTDEEIWDKSKQDTLAKVITTFQIGFLVVQSIGRAAQHLAITTLELNTLGIVACSLMTSCTWLRKPSDVRTPLLIRTSITILEITRSRPWKQTPLDFVDENGPGWAVNVQPFMKMPVLPPDRPIQRIPDDRFPMNPHGAQEYYLCFATLVFAAIHVAGWNFSFPSRPEQILWRVSSMLLFGITASFWILETMASWKRLGRWKQLYYTILNRKKLEDFEKSRTQRMMTETREPTELPLPWEFWTIFPLAVLYGLARFSLLAEAFLELRSLEATALLNVDWSVYFPHVT